MWLLDGNIDVHLVSALKERGVQCDTAQNRGWKALSNGELVAAPAAAGFDCLLTRNRPFTVSAARALRDLPHFAVVLVNPQPGRVIPGKRSVPTSRLRLGNAATRHSD